MRQATAILYWTVYDPDRNGRIMFAAFDKQGEQIAELQAHNDNKMNYRTWEQFIGRMTRKGFIAPDATIKKVG